MCSNPKGTRGPTESWGRSPSTFGRSRFSSAERGRPLSPAPSTRVRSVAGARRRHRLYSESAHGRAHANSWAAPEAAKKSERESFGQGRESERDSPWPSDRGRASRQCLWRWPVQRKCRARPFCALRWTRRGMEEDERDDSTCVTPHPFGGQLRHLPSCTRPRKAG